MSGISDFQYKNSCHLSWVSRCHSTQQQPKTSHITFVKPRNTQILIPYNLKKEVVLGFKTKAVVFVFFHWTVRWIILSVTFSKETFLRCHMRWCQMSHCFCHEQCVYQYTRSFIDAQKVAALLRRDYLKYWGKGNIKKIRSYCLWAGNIEIDKTYQWSVFSPQITCV